MWSALKSTLLIGADLRDLTPAAFTILNNPAIIAINQDPLSRPAVQISRDLNVKKDKYGVGEAQVWSGPLSGGDQVVVFLNAADEDLDMEADLIELFHHESGNRHAAHLKETWAIYDLWAGRMDEKMAAKILDAPTLGEANQIFVGAGWYNSTALPYEEGLKDRDARLLGKKIGTIRPGELLKAKVKRHSVEMFRLVSEGGDRLKNQAKDEL